MFCHKHVKMTAQTMELVLMGNVFATQDLHMLIVP